MLVSYKLWAVAEAESKTSVFTQTGGLDISHREYEIIKQLIAAAEKYNIPIEVMTPQQVHNKFPSVTIPEDNVGVYSPDSGILNATKAVAMFQYLAKVNNCVLKDNIVVTKIYQHGSGTTIVETKNGKEFLCSKCIITAGPWSKKFLKNIDIDLPLKPLQTTVTFWPITGDPSIYSSTVFPVFLKYQPNSFIYGKKKDFIRQNFCRNVCSKVTFYDLSLGFPSFEFPNMIKCCAHAGPEVDPDNRDFFPEIEESINKVAPFIRSTFQGIDTVPKHTESCVYTFTPDEDFIVDELPGYSGIFVGCGFSGHGFKLAPVVGHILSSLALSKSHPYPQVAKYFSIGRFKQTSKM